MILFISKGGPLMWILLAASVVVAAVFAERLLYLRRAAVAPEDFLTGFAQLIRRGSYAEALLECRGTQAPVGRIALVVIEHADLPRNDLKEMARETGQMELVRLEEHMPILETIAQVAPLIGLLGTVTGMIQAFMTVSAQSGSVTANSLSDGVYTSLLTTAAGLAVAIPANVGYNYLSAKINALMHAMERTGIEVVNLVVAHPPGAAPCSAKPSGIEA